MFGQDERVPVQIVSVRVVHDVVHAPAEERGAKTGGCGVNIVLCGILIDT
jgi:hypothetical protein